MHLCISSASISLSGRDQIQMNVIRMALLVGVTTLTVGLAAAFNSAQAQAPGGDVPTYDGASFLDPDA